jgi:hypothetical protein
MFDFLWRKKSPEDLKADEQFLDEVAHNFANYEPRRIGDYSRKLLRAGYARVGSKSAIIVAAISKGEPLRNRVGGDSQNRWNEPICAELLSLEQGRWSLSDVRQRLLSVRAALGANHCFCLDEPMAQFVRTEPALNPAHVIPVFRNTPTDFDLRSAVEIFLDQLKSRSWMLPGSSKELANEARSWVEDKPISPSLMALLICVKASRLNVSTTFMLDIRSR